MKRFWLVLLSLGLVMAFSASAFAVDVKFSGTYYAAGAYLDKVTVLKNTPSVNSDQSTAFYFQKLQLTTEFVASPGLSLVTRANIMERVWGNTRSASGTALDTVSAATRAENENIGFDYAYINYASPIGIWKVGYMSDSTWGTVFGDSSTPRGKISYTLPIGNFKIGASVVKYNENSLNSINAGALTDNDKDKYGLNVTYIAKSWEAGLLGSYYSDATNRAATTTSYKGKYYNVQPYAKAKIGPVAIEAELSYYFGKYAQYDESGNIDKDVNSLSGYVDAVGTFGPVYVGATFAYAQGQGDNADKVNNVAVGGTDWNPTLILWNLDTAYWVNSTNFGGTSMTNAFLYQVRGGVKPTDKLNIGVSAAFAQKDTVNGQTDTTSYNRASKDIGWEIDVTGTYKITNNLSYMLGVGYLIPGDYYKGNDKQYEVTNTYLVINKLALTF